MPVRKCARYRDQLLAHFPVTRDNVDGGQELSIHMVGRHFGDFVCLFVFNIIVCSQANLHSSTKPCICNEFPGEMEIVLLIT